MRRFRFFVLAGILVLLASCKEPVPDSRSPFTVDMTILMDDAYSDDIEVSCDKNMYFDYDLNPEEKAISVSFSDLDAVHGDQARHTYTVSMTGTNIPEGTVVKIMSDGFWSNVELLSNTDGKVRPYKVYGSLNTIEVTYDDIVNGI